jgi:ABC-type transporter Mla MlaB component
LGSGREPTTITLVVAGSLARRDVPCLCARLRTAIEAAQAQIVVCDVGAVRSVDVGILDALARLELTARRSGGRIRLRRCSPELAALLAFAGLAELFPVED